MREEGEMKCLLKWGLNVGLKDGPVTCEAVISSLASEANDKPHARTQSRPVVTVSMADYSVPRAKIQGRSCSL